MLKILADRKTLSLTEEPYLLFEEIEGSCVVIAK